MREIYSIKPGLLAGKKEAKQLVIEVLSKEWPLSAKEVFYRVRKESANNLTYQGIHKALKLLEQDGVVLREEAGYLLSRDWLLSSIRGLQKTLALYDGVSFAPFSDSKIEHASSFGSLLLLKQLLSNKQFSMTRDEVLFFDHRLCMVPVGLYLQWISRLVGPEAKNVLYYSARAASKEIHGGIKKKGWSKEVEDELRFKVDTMCFAGWGEAFFGAIDLEQKHATASMNFSPVAAEYRARFGKSKWPLDDAVRGFLAGVFTIIFDDPSIECVETQCIAAGAEKCVFEITPRAEFDSKSPPVKAQLAK